MLPEAAAGADQTLELLYRDHAQDVSRYALAVLGDRADAEDVTQTTFLNAYRALQRGERPMKPENWLIAIAHNACRERFRNGQRRPREVVFLDEVSGGPVRVDDGPTADELRGALLQLPESQRRALVLRELEGRPYGEIAQALDISVAAVETLLFRARQALREQLEEQLLCRDAVVAISRQVEGGLPRGERASLRAHLRRCPECSHVARSLRARPAALGGFLPVPSWLSSLFARGSASAVGVSGSSGAGAVGLVAKAAAIVVTGAVVGGGVSEGAKHIGSTRAHPRPGTVPAVVHPAHAPSSVPGSHAPVRAAGAEAWPTTIAPTFGSESQGDNVPGQSTPPAPQDLVPTDATATAGLDVPQVSTGAAPSGTPAGGNGHTATGGGKAVPGSVASNGANDKGAGTPGNSAKAKSTAPGKKNQPAAAAATPATPATPAKPTADPAAPATPATPATPAQPNAQANGQGNGEVNGQANGQGNGQPTVPPAGPPADVPPQSHAGGNGHN